MAALAVEPQVCVCGWSIDWDRPADVAVRLYDEHICPARLSVERFDHSQGDPEMTGMRGVTLDAETGYNSGVVFSTRFPTVFVDDAGGVEVREDLRVPRETAAACFRAVAEYLTSAPETSPPP